MYIVESLLVFALLHYLSQHFRFGVLYIPGPSKSSTALPQLSLALPDGFLNLVIVLLMVHLAILLLVKSCGSEVCSDISLSSEARNI